MVKLRFAPSPTGFLHVGGARTAIFNWLYARHYNGKFILRIEDTDKVRSTEESINAILKSMDWLGIDYDEGPIFQSKRNDIYLEHIERLLKSGQAYRCFCSREVLEEKRKKALVENRKLKPKYDGTCRELGRETKGNTPFVVRFRAESEGKTIFNDAIRGDVAFNNEELDDFIILRSDGSPTYNLVVTVDDALMEITHVIRGDDHINNTPKQLMLYNALEYRVPIFAHVPMILGSDRSRLSKRHGATSVMAYKEAGYLPQALLNYLVRLGWSFGDEEIFSRKELIEKFSLENVGKSAATFDINKLDWLNGHYIRNESDDLLAAFLPLFLERRGFCLLSISEKYIAKVVGTLKKRVKTLEEMATLSLFYFTEEYPFDTKAKEKFLKKEAIPLIEILIEKLNCLTSFEEGDIESVFRTIEGEGIKLKNLAQPVRVALTGTKISPGLFEVISVLGKEKTLTRLKRVIENIGG